LREYKFEAEVVKWLITLKQDRSASYAHYCGEWTRKEFIPFFAGRDVREIRTRDIEAFYRNLLREREVRGKPKVYAPKTVWTILTTLKSFFTWLCNLEVTEKVPRFPRVEVPERHRGWLNRENQAKVLSRIPDRYRLAFELLAEIAIRPGELVALKKKDLIDGELVIERAFDQFGNLRSTKTGKVLYKALSATMWERLLAHSRDLLPEAFLFTREDGSPWNAKALYFQWRYACKKAGIGLISLYAGTRHSRVSQKRLELEKSMGEALAKEIGHAKIATTMKSYARDRSEEVT
jgi:integrase